MLKRLLSIRLPSITLPLVFILAMTFGDAYGDNSAFNPIPGAAVGSVTNSDGTLTFSPTAGAVVGSLALAHANTWTGIQTFSSTGDVYLNGAVAWTDVFANGNSGTSKAINIDNGNLQSVTISGAVAMTLTAPTHTGRTTLIITENGTGFLYSITGCKWPGGTPITYSTAANKIDIVSIIYDGTNFFCMGGVAFN